MSRELAVAPSEPPLEPPTHAPPMSPATAVRVGQNFVYRFASQCLSSGINVVAMVMLGRALAVSGYGRYAYYYALISMIAPLSDLGAGIIITRELARAPEATPRWFGDGLVLKAMISSVVLVLVCAVAPVALDPTRAALFILVTATAMLDISQDPAIWILRGQERQDLEGVLLLVSQVTWAAGIALVVAMHGGLFALLATATVAFVVRSLVAVVLVVRRWGRPEFRIDPARLRRLVVIGLPFGLAMCLVTLYSRIGLVALHALSTTADVSAFQVAYLLSQPLSFVAAALSIAIFPAVSREIAVGGPLRSRMRQVVRCQFLLSLPIAVSLYLLAPTIIGLSFHGRGFGSAIATLQLLSCGIPIMFLNQASRYLLTALDRQWDYLHAVGLGCVVNTVLCLVLIPRQGPAGACIALLAAELAIGAWCQRALSRRVGAVAVVRQAARPLAATVLAGLPIVLLRSAPRIELLGIAAAIYLVFVWRFRAVSVHELEVAKDIARSFHPRAGRRARRAGEAVR